MEPLSASARWQHVKQLLQTVIELPVAERASWLRAACAGDDDLQAEVESLLAAHERTGSFLDTPAVTLAERAGADLLPGTRLGRYLILSLVGRGGMGVVYRAKDTQLGREVAIKVLSASLQLDETLLTRFEQEARAASALNHPNIITIHEFGHVQTEAGSFHYIVSELIEGETLHQRIARERLSAEVIAKVALQIASALTAAHEAGIVHRDIKPENIMLRPDGLVKVLDFGLAKLTEPPDGRGEREKRRRGEDEATLLMPPPLAHSLSPPLATAAGTLLGTINYMSPEQARGLPLDARTDLFSLGVVLYEMATGQAPFARETLADVLAAILEKEPEPLSECAPELPDELAQIITRTLQKDRAARYQSAQELHSDLLRWQSGTFVRVPAMRRPSTIWRWINEHRRRLTLGLVLLIVCGGAMYYYESREPIESIAVLARVSTTQNSETEYLIDGICETLINDLSRLPDLTVRPCNSSLRYRRSDVEPQAAGRELGVEAVLTAQITPHPTDLILSLALIDVRTNRQLWGTRHQRPLTALLQVQTEVAREVSEKLRSRLSPKPSPNKRYSENAEAYQLYFKGRFFWNQRTRDGYHKAIELFTQATTLDPAFAAAHAGLANCYVLGGGAQMSVHESMSKARAAAARALQLDESLAAAHAALGQMQHTYDWNHQEAEDSFQRAINLEPNYETAHHWYALLLAHLGRFPEALERIKRAQQLDPVSAIILKDTGMIYYYARQYDRAAEQCHKALELAPDFYPAHSALGDIYLQQGKFEAALAEHRRADELAGSRVQLTKVALGYGYAVAGQREKALALLKELQEGEPGRPTSAFYLALLATGLDQTEAALTQLEQAYQERSYRLIYLKVDPAFDRLRVNPRFAQLLQRIRLNAAP